MVIDGRPGKVSFSLSGASILLSVPSFWEQAGMPLFSFLLLFFLFLYLLLFFITRYLKLIIFISEIDPVYSVLLDSDTDKNSCNSVASNSDKNHVRILTKKK